MTFLSDFDSRADAILEAELKKLPSHEALTKQAEDYLTYLDKKSLRIGSQFRLEKRRRKRQAKRPRRPFGSQGLRRRPTKNGGQGQLSRNAARRPRRTADQFDSHRNSGGIPELAAIGDYGEALQIVSEQIAAQAGKRRWAIRNALERKKHPNCRWQNPNLRTLLEFTPGCPNSTLGDPRYVRLHSGACNNLTPGKQHFGLFGLPLARLQPADYADGVNLFRVSRATGEPLPNPRVISNRLSFALGHQISNRKLPDDLANVNFVFFAQLLDHDLGNTFPKPITATTPVFGQFPQLNCCGGPNANFTETFVTPTRQTRRWCISMKIPETDPFWSTLPAANRKECLHQQVTRAVPDFHCHLGPRQIMNQVTNWLDLSQIYNSKKDYFDQVNRAVLALTPGTGVPIPSAKLLTQRNLVSNEVLMPSCPIVTRPVGAPPVSCSTCFLSAARLGLTTAQVPRSLCFIGGDFRTDENIALAAHQTLWVREHNRLVDILQSANPTWSQEKLFQEARRLNIAQWQHIVYNEFLPILIGPKAMREQDLYSAPKNRYKRQYDPTIEPTIQNVFNTAAFRFGHGMLPDSMTMVHPSNNTQVTMDLHDLSFDFTAFGVNGWFNNFFTGMMKSKAGRASGFFAAKARDILNPSPVNPTPAANVGGFDLLAWNINRGRDHGLPPYHTWLELTTGQKPTNWRFFENFFERGPITVYTLKTSYKTWKDLDLYLAGLLEKVPRDRFGKRNQVVGPTYSKIISSQFARLRRGDRFFYDDNSDPNVAFSLRELREIKKVTFAHILCNNLNNATSVLRHAFLQETTSRRFVTRQRKFNTFVPCSQLLNEPRNRINYNVFRGNSNIN